jgi:hypothetical protein
MIQTTFKGLVLIPTINPIIDPIATPKTTPKNTLPGFFLEGSFSMVRFDLSMYLLENLKIHKKHDAINMLYIDKLE